MQCSTTRRSGKRSRAQTWPGTSNPTKRQVPWTALLAARSVVFLTSATQVRRYTACAAASTCMHASQTASARAWALMIAGVILYGPANFYPVLTVVQLGSGAPSTIMGGVVELLSSGMYPLAALVFCASILVPVLKLIALGSMLVATGLGSGRRLRDRTKIYRVVAAVGRWSMIDVFMTSILVALVHFGGLVTITAGPVRCPLPALSY